MELDDFPFIPFGTVARNYMGTQCQYGIRYTGLDAERDGEVTDYWATEEMGSYPMLGEGLRFQGVSSEYHFVLVHAADSIEFLARYHFFQWLSQIPDVRLKGLRYLRNMLTYLKERGFPNLLSVQLEQLPQATEYAELPFDSPHWRRAQMLSQLALVAHQGLNRDFTAERWEDEFIPQLDAIYAA